MTREMRKEDRTLENVLDDDFIPENVDKWVDELVSEINWDEDSTTDDEDVIRNFDDESSNYSFQIDIYLLLKSFSLFGSFYYP